MKSCYEIAFEEWLKNKTQLSESSQYKYLSAIKGSISQKCIDYGVTKVNLLEVRDPILFENIRECLEGDERYIYLNEKGNDMYKRSMDYFAKHLKEDLPSINSFSFDGIQDTHPIVTTESVAIIKARKGQGKYRKLLESYWGSRCSVTGTPDSNEGTLLIASHIKPWLNSNNKERIDKFNGLLLTPNLDKAFDRGYITFDESGGIIISSQLNSPLGFGISNDLSIPSNKLNQNHYEYLDYHRKKIFISEISI
tara:strand:- start:66 stop:821 length:756 start_codon:yes stop_codon:yes gene_type:complete